MTTLIQYAGRDPQGAIQRGVEWADSLRFRDFTGWTALTFRDLDKGRLIERPGHGQ